MMRQLQVIPSQHLPERKGIVAPNSTPESAQVHLRCTDASFLRLLLCAWCTADYPHSDQRIIWSACTQTSPQAPLR